MGRAVGGISTAKLLRALPEPLQRIVRRGQDYVRRRSAERTVASFRKPEARPHGLPGELIVTLTSFPPRYRCLRKTLASLLMQDVCADRVILWLSSEPGNAPPSDVLELQAYGLEIRYCDDIRSYKKIIPALEEFPDAFLVTADDDLYYESGWLGKLVDGYLNDDSVIICRRAHRPKIESGTLLPYEQWDHDFVSEAVEACLFPTTGAGVLFPPRSLAPEVVDRTGFLEICPFADDVWLFVMALRAGSRFRQVGGGFPQIAWEVSQSTSLLQHNLGMGGNDRQLSAVLARYGDDRRISIALRALSC